MAFVNLPTFIYPIKIHTKYQPFHVGKLYKTHGMVWELSISVRAQCLQGKELEGTRGKPGPSLEECAAKLGTASWLRWMGWLKK